jgi:NAD(P)-dependent dehydrogenase (short-subunit alcohol dehydrogenase family)
MSHGETKKTVVITGASSGIGRACALRMVKAEWSTFATVRKPAEADDLQHQAGPNLTPLIMDVKDHASIVGAVKQVGAQLNNGGLHGLVNVAGIGMTRPIEYVTPDDLREMFDVNVFGQIDVSQSFLPLIRKARGRIVNISSVGAHIAIPFGGLLNATKGALGLLSDAMRLELRPFGVRVCSIEPGSIKTPAVGKTLGDVEAVIGNLPAAGAVQYGDMLRSFTKRAYAREMKGSPPDVVAEAVWHALTSRRPHTRYPVGSDSRLLVMLPRILPDRILDALRLRIFGLPTRFGTTVQSRSK